MHGAKIDLAVVGFICVTFGDQNDPPLTVIIRLDNHSVCHVFIIKARSALKGDDIAELDLGRFGNVFVEDDVVGHDLRFHTARHDTMERIAKDGR